MIHFLLQCLFRTPLNNYNAIILLHRDRLPYPQRLLFPSEMTQGGFLSPLHACLCLLSLTWPFHEFGYYWPPIMCFCWAGRHVAQGNASKDFLPYILRGDVHGNSEEIKKKLMVNFDPTWCFVEDIKVLCTVSTYRNGQS